MKIDSENRIKYGSAWIKENPNWRENHPLGPVHWDIWDWKKELIAEDIGAFDMPPLLESKGMLIRW